MIDQLFIYESDGFDPYRNLAIEEYFLTALPERAAMLYLWQNEKTIVIGRNQSARRECDVAALSADGGRLARRLSGGGAVYHDPGNLNFTFFLRSGDYDVARQCGVLLAAARALGIDAELSGRNDLTVDGRKFSGNAYYRRGDRHYHHGTLMIGVDIEKMQKYLLVSDEKLKGKGVASVRSRVVNLREARGDITVARVREALKTAFCAEYAAPLAPLPTPDEAAVAALTRKYSSDEWLYGDEAPYDAAMEKRFPWGAVRLEISLENGAIASARAYTDAMDETLARRLSDALRGAPLKRAYERVESEELREWLKEAFT